LFSLPSLGGGGAFRDAASLGGLLFRLGNLGASLGKPSPKEEGEDAGIGRDWTRWGA
jgi:hypothetical protein